MSSPVRCRNIDPSKLSEELWRKHLKVLLELALDGCLNRYRRITEIYGAAGVNPRLGDNILDRLECWGYILCERSARNRVRCKPRPPGFFELLKWPEYRRRLYQECPDPELRSRIEVIEYLDSWGLGKLYLKYALGVWSKARDLLRDSATISLIILILLIGQYGSPVNERVKELAEQVRKKLDKLKNTAYIDEAIRVIEDDVMQEIMEGSVMTKNEDIIFSLFLSTFISQFLPIVASLLADDLLPIIDKAMDKALRKYAKVTEP